MGVSDILSDDAAIFLDTADFGTAATYKALGAGGGTSCTVVVSEDEAPLLELSDSHNVSRSAVFAVPAATVTAPARTDTYTIASGPHAGTWVCVEAQGRDSAIHMVRCRLETIANTVAEGAHEVRS